MGKDKHKCCCKDKYHGRSCYCEKKCNHDEHCNTSCEASGIRRRCCKCRSYCKMIYFKKYRGCCKFVYKCECGYCFEYICDSKNNHCYERESCCLGNDNKIKAKASYMDKSCCKKKTCSHSGTKKKSCKCN